MATKMAEAISSILVNHGVIDRAAIEDPEGYDGGLTKLKVMEAAREIAELFQSKKGESNSA